MNDSYNVVAYQANPNRFVSETVVANATFDYAQWAFEFFKDQFEGIILSNETTHKRIQSFKRGRS